MKVAVLGASPKPDRYAYRAFRMLLEHGHEPVPVNPAYEEIDGIPCWPTITDVKSPHTITVYLAPAHLHKILQDIISAAPTRVILNPGTEDPAIKKSLREAGIPVTEACTLVMLRTGQF